MSISLRAPTVDDLDLLQGWLAAPHVRRWWQPAASAPVIAALQAGTALPDSLTPFIALTDGQPLGYIHAYPALAAQAGIWAGVEGVSEATRAIDLLIGEADLVNRKLGRAMVFALATQLFEDPAVDRIVAAPHPDNWACIIALKRIGFRDRGRLRIPGTNASHVALPRGFLKAP